MVTVIYYKDLKLRKGKLDCLNNISIFTTKNFKNCLSCYIKPFYLGLKGQKKKKTSLTNLDYKSLSVNCQSYLAVTPLQKKKIK